MMTTDTCVNIVTSAGTWVTAIATCFMAGFAHYQLSKLNKSLNDSNLMAIFEIEFELNRRKERLADLRKENEDFIGGRKKEELTDVEIEIFEKMHIRYNEALENYLNIFDRLCYFILKNKLNEDDFRTEYRNMLKDTIESFPNKFQADKKYRNMTKLHEKWLDE